VNAGIKPGPYGEGEGAVRESDLRACRHDEVPNKGVRHILTAMIFYTIGRGFF